VGGGGGGGVGRKGGGEGGRGGGGEGGGVGGDGRGKVFGINVNGVFVNDLIVFFLVKLESWMKCKLCKTLKASCYLSSTECSRAIVSHARDVSVIEHSVARQGNAAFSLLRVERQLPR